MTRAEKYAEITRRRAKGFTYQQIGLAMGMSPNGVRNLINDPDGSKQKARRERYRGTCDDCGKKTDGSNGYGNAPVVCVACGGRRRKVWTREAVITAMHLWAATHNDRRPVATDWQDVKRGKDYPSLGGVCGWGGAPFRSWGEAVEAAGFPRPRRGQRPEDVAA